MSEQYRLSMEAALDQWKKAASQQGEKIITLQSDLQALRDERDRLRGALKEIAGNLAGSPKRKLMIADDDFWATPGEHTLRQWLAQAALTPAGGGQERANDSHIG